MFLIMLTYKKTLDEVDKHLASHRAFLEEGYRNNFFVVSGPRNPRTGGIIISQLKNKNQLVDILKQDPFTLYDVADYEIIEFSPVKHHEDFSIFI